VATSKIQKVNFLAACITYCTKYEKTDFGKYITTHECNLAYVKRDFENLNALRKQKNKKPWTVENYMIIQSFKPNEVTADVAHEIGVKFANQYLKNEHQYMVTTHIDKDHIHNHIVFNATSYKSLKSFDSRTKHIIDDLRILNDVLCLEYGLSVIKNPKQKGISQKEYYARKYDRSYKAKLEKIIDNAIQNSDNWQDFLELMERNCNVKYGKYIAFKQVGQENFTRAKSLGIDYNEESLKYRIYHKEFEMERPVRYKSLIDKSETKFQGKENGGLRNWATKQNIDTFAKLANQLHSLQLSKDEILAKVADLKSRMDSNGKDIEKLDNKISDLSNLVEAQEIYKQSFSLINGLKQSENKAEYKRTHYAEFKEYDRVKTLLNKHKNSDGKLPTIASINATIEELKIERSVHYLDYQNLKSELSQLQYTNYMLEKLAKEKRISL
jgi:hypothetical protein